MTPAEVAKAAGFDRTAVLNDFRTLSRREMIQKLSAGRYVRTEE
jgi:hypothetical protein